MLRKVKARKINIYEQGECHFLKLSKSEILPFSRQFLVVLVHSDLDWESLPALPLDCLFPAGPNPWSVSRIYHRTIPKLPGQSVGSITGPFQIPGQSVGSITGPFQNTCLYGSFYPRAKRNMK